MNLLFVSMAGTGDLNSQSIYGDLLKTFKAHGHKVYAVNPVEKRTNKQTALFEVQGITVLEVKTGNLQKCGLVEKAVSQLQLEDQFLKAIRAYYVGITFDLVLFATPPTTLGGLVKKLKQEHNAKSYLLLKDIFPQNSVDLEMLSTTSIKGQIYRYFKKTEHETYVAADFIGCMSEANRKYLLENEPWLDADKVEVNPNTVIPYELSKFQNNDKLELRKALGLPQDKRVFVYGGNLGKPQAIDFLVRVLQENESRGNAFFAIAGGGTERHILEEYFASASPKNAKLFPFLSREDFNSLLQACDCGVVLLDYRFTIPNFPSRILSYMQVSLPYIAATDSSSDVGDLAEREGFGVKADSIDESKFLDICESFTMDKLKQMGEMARSYLEENFTTERSYKLIMERMND